MILNPKPYIGLVALLIIAGAVSPVLLVGVVVGFALLMVRYTWESICYPLAWAQLREARELSDDATTLVGKVQGRSATVWVAHGKNGHKGNYSPFCTVVVVNLETWDESIVCVRRRGFKASLGRALAPKLMGFPMKQRTFEETEDLRFGSGEKGERFAVTGVVSDALRVVLESIEIQNELGELLAYPGELHIENGMVHYERAGRLTRGEDLIRLVDGIVAFADRLDKALAKEKERPKALPFHETFSMESDESQLALKRPWG